MAPKQSKSALGPLAGRTLKGPSSTASPSSTPSGSGSRTTTSSASSPKRADPSSPSRNLKLSSSSLSASPLEPPSPPPYLLPRESETTSHRTLRRLLREFTRHRDEWEEEVIETAEFVGRYCTALGEVEDERWEGSERRGDVGRNSRRRSGDESGSESDSDSDSDSGSEDERPCPATTANTLTLTAALRDLDETYHLIEQGRVRICKQHDALVKVKDELRRAQVDWMTRRDVVSWGQRDGDEFVEAATSLILQVQLQTAQLIASIDELYVACSPVGSLHAAVKDTRQKVYNAAKASSRRKDILLLWRDLPLVERGGGSTGFNWWRNVWEKEVGRWSEL